MREAAEVRHWTAVLSDPGAPPELKAEAARHLKIQVPATGCYTPDLDELVQSFWHRRKSEDEQRNGVAERIYFAMVTVLLLGGIAATIEDDACILLSAFENCESEWVRTHAASSLEAIRAFHPNEVSPETLSAIQKVLK